ncbi:MAG: hypothetical protein GX895_04595 [Clostridiales bacterium]|uniref:hypothetical protein n=1 Tax=Clostridium sp. N3C TaxID=1776758 RepID=UPI00092DFDD0|nr:hypothetical protein [Clostridium sp. N3C]NLZ48059.1 hypothetical protein [Clostridiales bacterium]SCN22201.1 hypothetical protein N3C_0640 [Clostridium sp. N3C]
MSRRKKKEELIKVPISTYAQSCICSLSQIAILILIILQFSNKGTGSKLRDKDQQISNEILFIIALYFLSCIECSYRYPYSIINIPVIQNS